MIELLLESPSLTQQYNETRCWLNHVYLNTNCYDVVHTETVRNVGDAAYPLNSGGKSTSAVRALEQPRGSARSWKEVFKPLFEPW